MLALVLGSSFQAFELMLSAFITGLALGGLWIRKRIDRFEDPTRVSGYVQLLMGLLALATVLVYHLSFDWMQWMLGGARAERGGLHALQSREPRHRLRGHAAGHLHGRHDPAAVHARADAPRARASARSASCTPPTPSARSPGSSSPCTSCCPISASSGRSRSARCSTSRSACCSCAARSTVCGAWRVSPRLGVGIIAWRSSHMARFSIRRGSRPGFSAPASRPGHAEVTFYRDGKTSSVALRRGRRHDGASTNGKPDAGIVIDLTKPPAPDESTMMLLAAIPLLMKPDARRVANIGFGSGLTIEVALSAPQPRAPRHDRDRAGDGRGRARVLPARARAPSRTRAATSTSRTRRPTSRATRRATT